MNSGGGLRIIQRTHISKHIAALFYVAAYRATVARLQGIAVYLEAVTVMQAIQATGQPSDWMKAKIRSNVAHSQLAVWLRVVDESRLFCRLRLLADMCRHRLRQFEASCAGNW